MPTPIRKRKKNDFSAHCSLMGVQNLSTKRICSSPSGPIIYYHHGKIFKYSFSGIRFALQRHWETIPEPFHFSALTNFSSTWWATIGCIASMLFCWWLLPPDSSVDARLQRFRPKWMSYRRIQFIIRSWFGIIRFTNKYKIYWNDTPKINIIIVPIWEKSLTKCNQAIA